MNRTKIPWVRNADGTQGYTWNPIVGCSPASEGCANCYAAAMSKRFGLPWGKPITQPARLYEPASIKKPSRIFVCSMSDLFHDDVTRDDHETIFGLMRANERHTFILLTKRPERMRLAFGGRIQPPNVWIGITAENQARFDERWPVLESIPVDLANNRKFISIEPMLGPVKLSESCLNYASWIIAGPENGAGKRPFEPDWIDRLSGQCERTGIPFFDKRELEGVIREMPE